MNKFSLRDRLRSFRFAGRGLKDMWANEHNFRVQLFAGLAIVFVGLVLKFVAWEWLAVFLSIGVVLALEVMNTALETFCNYVSPERDDTIGRVKDLSAAAVLLGAMTSVVIALIVVFSALSRLWVGSLQ